MKIVVIVMAVWAVGFGITLHWHSVMAPNATLALMALRSTVWPLFWATGRPRGQPMRMD